ncbi:uncharacterized protein LOC111990454 [Quercus suber]|uniref:uncharacterized protein LOC111990454 n=1 Tax=Quercus suber TaxID=58331 RepID=UPI0032E0167E
MHGMMKESIQLNRKVITKLSMHDEPYVAGPAHETVVNGLRDSLFDLYWDYGVPWLMDITPCNFKALVDITHNDVPGNKNMVSTHKKEKL